MSNSVRPHRQQSTRLPRPCDSPGKNTGVGCHFLLQCRKVKSESEVAHWYLTFSDPMDYSLPGYSVHGIFQARVLEWSAIAFSVIFMIRTSLKWSLSESHPCIILLSQDERSLWSPSNQLNVAKVMELVRLYWQWWWNSHSHDYM